MQCYYRISRVIKYLVEWGWRASVKTKKQFILHSLIIVKFSDHRNPLPESNQTTRRSICINKNRKAKASYHRELIDQNLSNRENFGTRLKLFFQLKRKRFVTAYTIKKILLKNLVYFSVQSLKILELNRCLSGIARGDILIRLCLTVLI